VTKNRRQFIVQSPLGIVGTLAAGGAWSRRAMANPITASATGGGAASASTAERAAGRPVLRWVPKHDELVYTFGGAAPRRRIQPGTRVITWTEDCFDGSLKTAADLMSKVTVPGHDNPQTGPFFVEGAEPGDTLAVHILGLEPARSYAISAFSPGFGALVGNDQTAMLGPDLKEATWRYDVDAARKVARSTSGDGKLAWEVPLAPFLGCLGVAPADGEVRSTTVPDNFGGNMDCPEVRAGNSIYLNVNVPGALISFGDGHYAMGDGEIIGGAVEGAMNVDLVIDLIKGIKTPIPRIENEHEVMFVGCGRPLEDAARVAYKAMIGWIRDASGLSELDAYQFLSQNAEASIIQLVDPQYTVLVKLAKMRMPSKA
jgi:acetamidase/formamidase